MARMNLFTKQKQTHAYRELTCGCQGEWKEGDGWTGCFQLANANCYIWKKTTRSYLSTGNHIQSTGINHNGKDILKCMYTYN